jgi:multidrug efflux pump subunit AcrA (membrane-fusion protein)
MKTAQQKLADLQPKVEAAREAYLVQLKRWTRLDNQARKLEEQIDSERAKGPIDIAWLLEDSHQITKAHFDARAAFLSRMGLSSSGFFANTGQVQVQIFMKEDDEAQYKRVMDGLNLVMPYLIPNPAMGGKVIDVLDWECGSYSDYKLVVREDGRVVLKDFRFQRGDAKPFVDLNEAVRWVQKNRPQDRPSRALEDY